jgi:hypothetical protein
MAIPAPAPPAPLLPRPEAARAVILKLGAFALALAAAAHALLVTSDRFLGWCEEASGEDALPLRQEATLRRLAPGQFDVFFVGSSVAESHVDPMRLALRHRLRALALPMHGGTMVDAAMASPLLVRPRPRAVVVLPTVWTLFDHFDWRDVRVYDPGMAWRIFTLRELLTSPRDHASLLLGASHFVLRHRASLRDTLLETLRPAGGAPLVFDPDAAGARRRRETRVSAAAGRFRCPSVGSRALVALGARLAESGVATVLVPTPGNTAWDRSPEVVARFDACLADVAARTGATVVARSALPAMGPADFRDRTHLNRQAAQRFTDGLGEALAHIVPPEDGDAVQ